MKKRILVLIITLLLTTGCTCEYNLKIDGNKYSEEIIITAENTEERNNLNAKWEISTDKEEFERFGDPSSELENEEDNYNYKVNQSNLTLSYNFTKIGLMNASSVSRCYNKVAITKYENSTIISTSEKANCYSNYPDLSNLVVNIEVDRPVISHNADSVKGKIYTWNITKSNYQEKAINLVLDDSDNTKPSSSSSQTSDIKPNKKKKDYTLYIFSAILLIIMLGVYMVFNKIKNNQDKMDV